MTKELIVNATAKGVEIALLEDKKLVEFHKEITNNQFNVGDIYLGKVTKLMPGLNAAFVEVGFEKEAFLHYTDLGPNVKSVMKFTNNSLNGTQGKLLQGFELEPQIVKTGKVGQVLQTKQKILVQILKEPISTKGPRLNCEISLPGRFLVLTPFDKDVSISKKIPSKEERQRLVNIVESIRPENFGVIIRTAAEGKNTSELHQDMLQMTQKWEQMKHELHQAEPPKRVMTELDKTSSILRDLLNDSFNRILVNDKNMLNDIKNYVSKIAPDKANIINLHTAGMNIFDATGVTLQIKASFGKQVSMNNGGSLVIEKTEALHVIDVNSGNITGTIHKDTDEQILKINSEAAREVARQLRLRDMGRDCDY
jgi:ribonuclease G